MKKLYTHWEIEKGFFHHLNTQEAPIKAFGLEWTSAHVLKECNRAHYNKLLNEFLRVNHVDFYGIGSFGVVVFQAEPGFFTHLEPHQQPKPEDPGVHGF